MRYITTSDIKWPCWLVNRLLTPKATAAPEPTCSPYLSRPQRSAIEVALETAREALARIGRHSSDEYARTAADEALRKVVALVPAKSDGIPTDVTASTD